MDRNFKTKASFHGKHQKGNVAKGPPSAASHRKRTWVPGSKFFDGSVQEGLGFAFKRKQKIQHEYNKLLRKERRRRQDSRAQTTDYPEHLKHLYMAEQERLDKEEQMHTDRRRKGRAANAEKDEGEDTAQTSIHSSSVTGNAGSLENSAATASSEELPQSSQIDSPIKGSLRQRKQKNLSCYQKIEKEYERLKEEKERKREEYLKNKAQREEALKRYKDKKMATYQLLKKKTKKGQPNLNLQMELLLQKIQAQSK
ncbi:thyroid transcription factor 1-associated protein 26 homolog isoform X2 [Pygocentrus nattereri]|uniref:thyroid transcription factor 1-associated protein 26 homolog isoform X2 n=1 Tax=Pygocentrus nattereri TaxID=42514 RepID=UPI0008148CC3|nr:thyroid transcription factor 1-associated protein 26 homolog isoform X2 [Pygocentrus nattereri]